MENFKLNELPTQEYLRECFEYDNGYLIKKVRPLSHFDNKKNMNVYNNKCANTIANRRNRYGYFRVSFDKKTYMVHRIVWKLHYGEDPKEFIDHINGIRDDNRIENLREVTTQENSRNLIKITKANTTGYSGIYYEECNKKWTARVGLGTKLLHVGRYDTAEEAALAKELKAAELYGEDFYYANENNVKILEELKIKVAEIKKNKVFTKKYNLSGNYIGTYYYQDKNLWTSAIRINRKTVHLGYFDSMEEAALIRELKMLEILGEEEYTKQNRMSLLEELKEKVDVIKQERNSMI